MATEKKRVQVIMTDEEIDILKELAAEKQLSASAYMRTVFITSNAYLVKARENDALELYQSITDGGN